MQPMLTTSCRKATCGWCDHHRPPRDRRGARSSGAQRAGPALSNAPQAGAAASSGWARQVDGSKGTRIGGLMVMTMRWKAACERDADVRGMARRMARGDAVDPALRDHIEHCASCEETMSVALWMQ